MASILTIGLVLELLFICGLTWLAVKVFTLGRKLYRQHVAAAQFHSLPRHWLFGTLPLFRKLGGENVGPYIIEQSKQHGNVLVFWRTRLLPELFVTHAETIGEILRTSEPKNRRLSSAYTLSLPWLGDGLLISSGKKWERSRKLLTPAFHFNVLRPYMQVYNDAVNILLSKFSEVADTGQSFEVFGSMALCTLDIMLRCAFSYEGGVQEIGSVHPYVQAVKRMAHLVAERSLYPVLYTDWIYHLTKNGKEFKLHCDFVHNFADEIIEKRRTELADDPDVVRKRHLDFLDILLAARDEFGVGLSNEDMRAEVDTFLFAGHDTTASASSWAMYALAKYPDVQERVYQEVHEIMGHSEYFDWDDLSKLKYTSLFVKEVMRMYSPVPSTGRELSKPITIGGKQVPAGMVVVASIRSVHQNPRVWDSPQEFLPERFADDKYASRNPYSFVPFSAGPRYFEPFVEIIKTALSRNCIGQNFALNEEKVIVCRVVNKFRLVLDTDHQIVQLPELVTRAKYGIKLKFILRK